MACERKSSGTLALEKMTLSSVDTWSFTDVKLITPGAVFKVFMRPLFRILVLRDAKSLEILICTEWDHEKSPLIILKARRRPGIQILLLFF